MTNHLSDEAVRVCLNCAEIKPDTDFRRRYRDRPDRLNTCNSCHAAHQRERRARRRQQQQGMEIQKFATAYCSTRDQKRRQLILKIAIQSAGGFSQFLRSWNDIISTMISEKRYSPRLLRLYELIFELMRDDDERNREALKHLPDDDLQGLVHSQLKAAIQQDPQLAIDAAKRLGWSLTPTAVSEMS